jgi:hypothetical protein
MRLIDESAWPYVDSPLEEVADRFFAAMVLIVSIVIFVIATTFSSLRRAEEEEAEVTYCSSQPFA